MVPRRTHKKSRNGCTQCKQRRVKCDENGPVCKNCTKRQLPCSFSTDPLSPSSPSSSVPPQSVTSATNYPSPNPSPVAVQQEAEREILRKEIRARELGLMYQWTTSTFMTLCQNKSEQSAQLERQLMQIDIPAEALKYDYLMNALLTVTSLHVMEVVPNHQIKVDLPVALEYHTACCSALREELNSINALNCHAVFATVILMIISVMALAPPVDENGRSSSMNALFNYADIITGAREVSGSVRPFFQNEMFRRTVECWESQHPHQPLVETKRAMDILQQLNREHHETTDPSRFGINADLIENLEYQFAELEHGPDVGSSIVWLARCPSSYISDVQLREPVALAMLMCWAVMLDHPSPMWWRRKHSGKALIDEVCALGKFEDEKWQPLIVWARDRAIFSKLRMSALIT